MEEGRGPEVFVVRGLARTRLERACRRRRTLSRRRKDRDHVSDPRDQAVYYRRSRFTTHLPVDRRYSRAHYWLFEESAGGLGAGPLNVSPETPPDILELADHTGAGGR